MMKHYSDVSLTSPLAFIQTKRTGSFYLCHRFAKLHSPNRIWSYSGADGICVAVDKAIKLHGVQHFGSEGGEYAVSTEVKDVAHNSSLVKQ